jgi:hypothetical protein
MTMCKLLYYMEFLQQYKEGYFFDSPNCMNSDDSYDVMLKDNIWQIRLHKDCDLPQSPFRIYTDSSAFLTEMIKCGINQERIERLLQATIVEHALWHYMKFKEIERFLGEKIMEEGANSMAAFAEALKLEIKKFVEVRKGKLTLIKEENYE